MNPETQPRPAVDLEVIKKRVEAATRGPWVFNGYSCIDSVPEMEGGPGVAFVPSLYGDTSSPQGMVDAEFIAHAREDVPALLADLEQCRQMIAAAQQRLREQWDVSEQIRQSQMGALLSEQMRLQTELAAAQEAGRTLAAYAYALVNPGTLPIFVKAAMRLFEASARLDAARQEPATSAEGTGE